MPYVPSSGELWTVEEEEKLRSLFVELVAQMEEPHRSAAAVLSRLDRMAYSGGTKWPDHPITSLSRGVHSR